jgi:hypothetical protein
MFVGEADGGTLNTEAWKWESAFCTPKHYWESEIW